MAKKGKHWHKVIERSALQRLALKATFVPVTPQALLDLKRLKGFIRVVKKARTCDVVSRMEIPHTAVGAPVMPG
jgi:hypothetical protein